MSHDRDLSQYHEYENYPTTWETSSRYHGDDTAVKGGLLSTERTDLNPSEPRFSDNIVEYVSMQYRRCTLQ